MREYDLCFTRDAEFANRVRDSTTATRLKLLRVIIPQTRQENLLVSSSLFRQTDWTNTRMVTSGPKPCERWIVSQNKRCLTPFQSFLRLATRMLRFRNTLSGKIEEFRPLREGEVSFYYCGPTVWDYGHIGNFRSAIAADIVRRYLKFKGFKVTHVMNITDVEDRIIAKSQEAGLTIDDYTAKYIDALWEDFDALGCERPEIVPRATRHIPEMVTLIERLLETDHAYQSDGSIYYRIASFPEYGKLSKINFAGNIAGASDRIDTDRYEKEDARDFALWKEPATATEPAWDAPIGRGRPGWHIECSAMSMKYLGETFDIHAGGIDLVFPHHENEIAQSEGATGKQFVRYWIHFEHLKVDGETMSKSKGNYYTFRDVAAKGYSAGAVRYFLLSVPYNKQINFTFDALAGAEKTVGRLARFSRAT